VEDWGEKLALVKWLEHREDLINLNATPRADSKGRIRRGRGRSARRRRIHLHPSFSTRKTQSPPFAPRSRFSGGRWHLRRYDGERGAFLVIETKERKVIQAARSTPLGRTISSSRSRVHEGVGVLYKRGGARLHPVRHHPSVHVVDFNKEGEVTEIAIPLRKRRERPRPANDACTSELAHGEST